MISFPEVKTDAFEARVLKAAQPVIVQFTNDGCGLCKILAPALADVAREYEGEIEVVSVDTDLSPDIAATYHIQSVPALLMFSDGRLRDRLLGNQPRGRLAEFIETQLGAGQ
ncbi:Thioredoxin C-1 [compost metagenome]